MTITKKQMRMIGRHFKEDADALIKAAKSLGVLAPHPFLQRAVDAGLNAKGAEAMMLIGCGNPNDVDAVDSYSRIVSSSEAISQTRGTEKLGVFDTDCVKQKMRQLLKQNKQQNKRRK